MDTTFKKAVEALVEYFGDQAKAAKAIGVRQPTISGWLNNGHGVSPINALKVEAVTGGAVKAIDLCPGLSIRDGSAA